jgi:hypothetical protein
MPEQCSEAELRKHLETSRRAQRDAIEKALTDGKFNWASVINYWTETAAEYERRLECLLNGK